MTYRVLDLFCGAGGSAMGLHRAWPDAEITGVDIVPQKHYPFTFIQGDALTYPLEGFDFIWASPVCKGYTTANSFHKRTHEKLIGPVRERLLGTGVPFVIENVKGARRDMQRQIELCGTMFDLKVYRHRLFESNRLLLQPYHVKHGDHMDKSMHFISPKGFVAVAGHSFPAEYARQAMGIDWMSRDELSQAIPPTYAEYIACQIRKP